MPSTGGALQLWLGPARELRVPQKEEHVHEGMECMLSTQQLGCTGKTICIGAAMKWHGAQERAVTGKPARIWTTV